MRFSLLPVLALILVGTAAAETAPLLEKKAEVRADGIRWIDATELPIEGRAFTNAVRPYARLPEEAFSRSDLAQLRPSIPCPAGMSVRFTTDSDIVRVRWTLARKPPYGICNATAILTAGIDVYQDIPGVGWRFWDAGFPRQQTNELAMVWCPNRACLIHLPVSAELKSLQVGVRADAKVEPLGPRSSGVTKPVVVYGASLVHGFSSSRPGRVWTSVLSRQLDVPVVNQGYQGHGRYEPSMGEYLAAIDASAYCFFTCGGQMPVEEMREKARPFLEKLHRARPNVPILLGEYYYVVGPHREDVENEKRAFVRQLVDGLKAEDPVFWRNLYVVERKDLFGDDDEGTIDAAHFNDLGAERCAKAFGDVLRVALGLKRHRGMLLLTFDDPCWDGWVKAMPLFEKFGAHATFFPCGRLDATNAISSLRRLVAAGHTVGSHSVGHRDVPKVFSEDEGPEMYGRTELAAHARTFAKAGLPLEYFAYPNNRRTDETDALLSLMGGFRRFRAGAKTFRYNTNGTSIVSLDCAFFPVKDLPKHRVMRGTGVGSYYNTDIDDICRGIRRAGERDEVFVIFSHDIAEKPGAVGMRLDWLEKILATAADCGVAVKGFSELGPVDPIEPTEPMKVTLTFDDNVRDHLLIAAPEIEKRGWKGLFSIVTDWVGRTNKLSWAEVRELRRRGHEIAVHTKSHPQCGLGALAEQGKLDEVRREIAEARDVLTRELGEKPRYLCLPGSGYTPAVGKIAREEGVEPMLVKRACCGRGIPDTAALIARLRACGVPRYDFLVHGVCKAGGGWEPYPTKADFLRHLDAIVAAEKAGEIKIVTYDEIKENQK